MITQMHRILLETQSFGDFSGVLERRLPTRLSWVQVPSPALAESEALQIRSRAGKSRAAGRNTTPSAPNFPALCLSSIHARRSKESLRWPTTPTPRHPGNAAGRPRDRQPATATAEEPGQAQAGGRDQGRRAVQEARQGDRRPRADRRAVRREVHRTRPAATSRRSAGSAPARRRASSSRSSTTSPSPRRSRRRC